MSTFEHVRVRGNVRDGTLKVTREPFTAEEKAKRIKDIADTKAKDDAIAADIKAKADAKTAADAQTAIEQGTGNTKLLGLGLTQAEATALTGYTPPVVEE